MRALAPVEREAAEVTASRYNFGMTQGRLAAKAVMRKKLDSLSFSQKIEILQKLRDRSEAIAASGLRRNGQSDKSAKGS